MSSYLLDKHLTLTTKNSAQVTQSMMALQMHMDAATGPLRSMRSV